MPWKPKRSDDIPPFMCVSCHDLACNCRHSYSVRRYNFGHTPRQPSLKTTIYERGYMLPQGCHLDKNNKLIAKMRVTEKTKRTTRESQEKTAKSLNEKFARNVNGAIQKESDGNSKSRFFKTSATSDHMAKPDNWNTNNEGSRRDTSVVTENSRSLADAYNSPEVMERTLAAKPVSVRGAFLISGPHWASKGHTQQWPWRGKVQCRLWSNDNSFNHSRPATHAACFHS